MNDNDNHKENLDAYRYNPNRPNLNFNNNNQNRNNRKRINDILNKDEEVKEKSLVSDDTPKTYDDAKERVDKTLNKGEQIGRRFRPNLNSFSNKIEDITDKSENIRKERENKQENLNTNDKTENRREEENNNNYNDYNVGDSNKDNSIDGKMEVGDKSNNSSDDNESSSNELDNLGSTHNKINRWRNNQGEASPKENTLKNGFRGNIRNIFNNESEIAEEEDTLDNQVEGSNDIDTNEVETSLDSESVNPGLDNNTAENLGGTESQEGKSDNLSSGLVEEILGKSNLKKMLIIGALLLGIFVLLLFLIIIINSSRKKDPFAFNGYFDNACNYNETAVNVDTCDGNQSKLTLQEFVIGSTYYYTKGATYSDETLKALMILIKTNALSYGNYNSSSKNIELDGCAGEVSYCNPEVGCSTLGAADSSYISKLNNLYSDISNYIYVAESYQSEIASLSMDNALDFSDSILSRMEEDAKTKNYESILDGLFKNSKVEEDTTQDKRETFYLGDSRMLGILNSGVINNSHTIYGVGYGYDWLVGRGSFDSSKTNATSGGINGLNSLMGSGNYNIVIWLGVNDYTTYNADTYYSRYASLATNEWRNHNIYVVSVGPVLDSKAVYVDNEGINNFNKVLGALINNGGIKNLKYINLNLTEAAISNYDSEGIHYGNQDYKNIFSIISSRVNKSNSSKLSLYNLSDYCTYYTLAGYNAWWWPIGSANPSEGNIYGGTPVSVRVTSTFGPRSAPVPGASTNHGAIDIGTATGTPIIAARNGTVTQVNSGCKEGDSACGGRLGNYVFIDHGDGYETRYGHLLEPLVKVGDSVVTGQIIAYSDNTGNTSGPHLHFEVRVNGTKVDPLDYVSPDNPRPVGVDGTFMAQGNASDAKNYVCNTMLASGFSKNAVIGMMVNIQAESSFNPINLEGKYENKLGYSDSSYTKAVDDGTYSEHSFVHDSAGYGLIQWTYSSRKQALYDFAKANKVSIGDLKMQTQRFYDEFKTYKEIYKYMLENHSPRDMAYQFCVQFENPAAYHCEERIGLYLDTYTTYVNNGCK